MYTRGGSHALARERRRQRAKTVRQRAVKRFREKRRRLAHTEFLRTTFVDDDDVAILQTTLRLDRRSTTSLLSNNFIDNIVPFVMRPYAPVPEAILQTFSNHRLPLPHYDTMTKLELRNLHQNIRRFDTDRNVALYILHYTSQHTETDEEVIHTGDSTTEYESSSHSSNESYDTQGSIN